MIELEKKFLKTFGGNIATARKKAGITQQDLANELNMSVVNIAYIENGKQWTRPRTLKRIAKIIKVDVAELFKGV
jgi:transcriptional regulator with XRE-family HTH domain